MALDSTYSTSFSTCFCLKSQRIATSPYSFGFTARIDILNTVREEMRDQVGHLSGSSPYALPIRAFKAQSRGHGDHFEPRQPHGGGDLDAFHRWGAETVERRAFRLRLRGGRHLPASGEGIRALPADDSLSLPTIFASFTMVLS